MDMGIIAPFIISTAISIGPSSGDTRGAMKVVGKIAYKSTHLDKKVKYWEKKYINKNTRIYGGYAITLSKILTEKKISYEWSF